MKKWNWELGNGEGPAGVKGGETVAHGAMYERRIIKKEKK